MLYPSAFYDAFEYDLPIIYVLTTKISNNFFNLYMSISSQKKALNKNTILFLIGIVFSTILSSTLTIHGKSLPNNCPQNIYVDKSVIAFPKVKETQNVFQLITHGRPGELLINGEWNHWVFSSFISVPNHTHTFTLSHPHPISRK